jgi:hypothetical protein
MTGVMLGKSPQKFDRLEPNRILRAFTPLPELSLDLLCDIMSFY